MTNSAGIATPTGDFPCRGCGQYHPPYTHCLGQLVGHYDFKPYTPGTPVEPLPDYSAFQKPAIEQKLDKIIEQLEFICNELRRHE